MVIFSGRDCHFLGRVGNSITWDEMVFFFNLIVTFLGRVGNSITLDDLVTFFGRTGHRLKIRQIKNTAN